MGSGSSAEARRPQNLGDIELSSDEDAVLEPSEEEEWEGASSSEEEAIANASRRQQKISAKKLLEQANAKALKKEKNIPRHVVTERMRWECPEIYKGGFWRHRMGPLNDLMTKKGELRKTTRQKLLKERKRAMGKR
jgi:hypothetical protein